MLRFAVLVGVCLFGSNNAAEVTAGGQADLLKESLVFFAGFDGSVDATLGPEPAMRTAESTARKTSRPGNHSTAVVLAKDAGRFGDALRFTAVSKEVLYFSGTNVGYRDQDWSGTVSFWLKLNPDRDLAPGFCDPLQITDKTWNDAAMWVDFDKELPRAFRLGVFPTFKSWNPYNTPWDAFPVEHRPMIAVAKPPFSAEHWTHVAFTFQQINAADKAPAIVTLYLDGKSMGTLNRPLKFDWAPENAAIMLGLSYIGDFDELAIFSRALTADEIEALRQLPAGVGSL